MIALVINGEQARDEDARKLTVFVSELLETFLVGLPAAAQVSDRQGRFRHDVTPHPFTGPPWPGVIRQSHDLPTIPVAQVQHNQSVEKRWPYEGELA